MFKAWNKKRKVKVFINKLPAFLIKRYGPNEYYTKGQVMRTLDEEKFGSGYSDYALILYLSQENGLESIADSTLYHVIRKEIADSFFDGDINFKVSLSKRKKVSSCGHDSNCGTGSGS